MATDTEDIALTPPAVVPPPAPSWPQANFAFMKGYAAHWMALGFGAGLVQTAPGTVATAWAWAAFGLLNPWLEPMAHGWAWPVVLVLGFILGIWACARTALRLQVPDPGAIVWDEILAFWLILWVIVPQSGFLTQCAAFVLFRFFDALKWGPVAWADRRFKGFGWRGGLGIMLDDIMAAFMTLLLLAWWRA